MEYSNNTRFIHYTFFHGVALQDTNGYFVIETAQKKKRGEPTCCSSRYSKALALPI